MIIAEGRLIVKPVAKVSNILTGLARILPRYGSNSLPQGPARKFDAGSDGSGGDGTSLAGRNPDLTANN
jgi:hypothetical protein